MSRIKATYGVALVMDLVSGEHALEVKALNLGGFEGCK